MAFKIAFMSATASTGLGFFNLPVGNLRFKPLRHNGQRFIPVLRSG
jgi:hypothetical protein